MSGHTGRGRGAVTLALLGLLGLASPLLAACTPPGGTATAPLGHRRPARHHRTP